MLVFVSLAQQCKAQPNTIIFISHLIKLCLVGKFLTEGILDFPVMQHTMAAIWKPGKGVYIKQVYVNLFVFQFYHEIDLNRVIDGSPWSFNRKVLLIGRMNKNMNPRCVPLDAIDLWVQVHDMQPGFMTKIIMKEIGNQVGKYISSCASNYKGVWREYMRIRVTIDITKPLKRRINVRQTGNEWSWITFKYENVPTFCFICGIFGHTDKFCSKIFDTKESEIAKPYGVWMRAQPRRKNNLIGAKWLRNGGEVVPESSNTMGDRRNPVPDQVVRDAQSVSDISLIDKNGNIQGDNTQQKDMTGMKSGISNK